MKRSAPRDGRSSSSSSGTSSAGVKQAKRKRQALMMGAGTYGRSAPTGKPPKALLRMYKGFMALRGKGRLPEDIDANYDADNLFICYAKVHGPRDCEWERYAFKIRLQFSSKFPHEAPQCIFESPIYHPNVDSDGLVCKDILGHEQFWTYLIAQRGNVLVGCLKRLQQMLVEPNSDSPMNHEAAKLYKLPDQAQFWQRLHETMGGVDTKDDAIEQKGNEIEL